MCFTALVNILFWLIKAIKYMSKITLDSLLHKLSNILHNFRHKFH